MTRSKKSLIAIVSILMFANSAAYFYAAYGEMGEATDAGGKLQTLFFTASGIMFFPLGIWMLKNRIYSRGPYVISVIISISLILLYVASRTMPLPVVGIQEDVGPLDVFSKIIQGGVISLSLLLLPYIKKEQLGILNGQPN